MRARTPSASWWPFLVACAAVRIATPLAALACEGRALPGLPAYDYGPLYGDANGYYAGAREAVSAARRDALVLVTVAMVATVALVVARRAGAPGWLQAMVAGGGIVALASVVVLAMQPAGTPVVGWSLLWAVPLFPLRVLDRGVGPDGAFVVGLALSLVANAVTVVGTAYLGLLATGRRSVGMVAAALMAAWPFVPALVTGAQGWENGMWNVDVGLALYTEPLSTALVVVALVLLLRTPPTDLAFVLAGLVLGYATLVKLTNGGIAAGLVVVLLVFGRRRGAALTTVSGLLFVPALVAFWRKGYGTYYDGGVSVNPHPFGFRYVFDAWSDSSLFTPILVALLVVPGLVGLVLLSTRFARAVIGVPIVVTVATYSVYDVTPLHPRFFYVVLPAVLVLDAAALVGAPSSLLRRSRAERKSVRAL